MKIIIKRNLKGFIFGIIVAALMMSTALGEGFKKTIEVDFDSINVTVNGKNVDSTNIVYKGTTYVPLREVGEMLGKEVEWNGSTNTASIYNKGNDYNGLITETWFPI